MPEWGQKHSPHSGTSARMGTSAEMGVKVVQGSLSSSGTGCPVPELGASHNPVLELGIIFGPRSGTGMNSPSSGTGTFHSPCSRTGTVPDWVPAYICWTPFRHRSSSGTGRPVPELEHPHSQIGTVPKWGTQCWNWTIQGQWAWCNFAIHAVLKLGDQF